MRRTMRRVICLAGVSLILVSMGMMGCAPKPKTIITFSNLPTLIGKWEGWTTFDNFQGMPVLTALEITNGTVPVQGRITLEHLPDRVAFAFPADAKTAGDNIIINFDNGMVSNNGTLLSRNGQNFLELTYYVGEKQKFEGWFYYYGAKGTMRLTKK